MSGYTKLFSSITMSTIWRESNETRIVWITMLAAANMDGVVDSSLPGLADLARVSIKECEKALQILMAPDPYSRTKTDEGRRIKEIEGGWVLLNHSKYRDMLKNDPLGNAEDRTGKIYFIQCDQLLKIGFSKNPWARLAALKTGMSGEVKFLGCIDGTLRDELNLQKQFKASRFKREWYKFTPEIIEFLSKTVATGSDLVATTKNGSTTTELQYTTTDTTTDKDKYILSGKPDEMEIYSTHARAALHWLNEKSGKKFRESEKSLAPINARLKEKGVDIEGVKKMIERQCQRWLGTSMAEYLRPETLFGKEKFDGYYAARELPVIADGKQNQQRIDRSIGTANEGKAANYRGIKSA